MTQHRKRQIIEGIEILNLADNSKWGCGATVRFPSGEPCMLSIAQSSIIVKKSRLGILGAILYKEKDTYKNVRCSVALSYLFPNRLVPTEIMDPNLCAFLNAILHCKNATQVCTELNGAVAKAEAKAGGPIEKIPTTDFPNWVLLSTYNQRS